MVDSTVTSRRSFLRHAGLAAGFAAVPFTRSTRAQTRKLRPISMRLDWLYQAHNDGFIVAQEKGFYEQVGLNVEVGPGRGSGSTAQLVASKATMFGFADGYVVGNSVAKGLDIKMVACVYRRNPTAVIVLAESDVKTPKDLEGKSIGIPSGATQFQQWPAFVKGCGLDGSKIRIVNMDPAGSVPALLKGQVPAIAGYALGYVPGIEVRGKKEARIFWYADCGVQAVSNGVIVHNDLIKQEPDLVRDFVVASMKGFLYGREHPEEAIDIIKKYAPTSDAAMARRGMEIAWAAWVTPATAGKPLGWMSQEDWEKTVVVLKEYGGVTEPLQAKQLYTNEFVPTGAEFVPPQSGVNPDAK